MQLDPLGALAGDVNYYRFIGNNTIHFVDPVGLIKTIKDRERVLVTRKKPFQGFFGLGLLQFDNPLLPPKTESYYEDLAYEVKDDSCKCKVDIEYRWYYGKEVKLNELQELLDEGFKKSGLDGWRDALKKAANLISNNLKTYDSLSIDRQFQFPKACKDVSAAEFKKQLGGADMIKRYDQLSALEKPTDAQKLEKEILFRKISLYTYIVKKVTD